MVVHGEMNRTPLELEQQLARIAVAFVLLNGVRDGLLGELVLQLKGDDGQTVDEDAEVKRQPSRVLAIT